MCILPRLLHQQAERKCFIEKYISQTHLRISQFLPFGDNVEPYPQNGSFESSVSDQQDDENDVGEGGSEVDNLGDTYMLVSALVKQIKA